MKREKPFLYIDTNFSEAESLMLKLAFDSYDFEIVGISTVSSYMQAREAAENIVGMSEIEDLYLSCAKGNEKNLLEQDILIRQNNEKIFDNKKDYLEEKAACENLYDLAKDCGKIDIIATGPLTNIAKALREHEDLEDYIGHIFILGGTFSQGDVTSKAEYNFFTDPIAADEILNTGIETFILPLDLSRSLILNDKFLQEIKTKDELLKKILERYKKLNENLRFVDAVLLLYLYLTPQAFIFEELGLKVNSKEDRGKVFESNSRKKVYVANRVNENTFFDFLKGRLNES